VKRGDFFRVRKPSPREPKRFRTFMVVSRQVLIDSRFSTVICAPVYSVHHGLSTQVAVGPDEGLRQDSSIHCDELVSLPKTALMNFVGSLPAAKRLELDKALSAALALDLPPRDQ
jgi:mRNA interferase MazF